MPAGPPSPSPTRNGFAAGDFELRHWRTSRKPAAPALWWPPPPAIEIPRGDGDGVGGGGHGYTSLRDILSSPAAGYRVAGCGDIRTIRHPLVKRAAHAYLQTTPSAREDPGRRRRWRGPLRRLLLDCLSFVGALFRP